ncbi:MAG: shikimate dehydrogenase [Verrucomicrobiota bacterium]
MPEPLSNPINAATRYCGVYGHPVKHSASPAMQNAGIAALGLNWRYLAFDVHPNDLASAIAGAKAMKYIGLNLTIPHKLLALGMVEVLDKSAQVWGAVNTIRFESKNNQGDWVPLAEIPAGEVSEIQARGFNTDADAITRSLKEDLDIDLKNSSVLLLGAGGAGRVAALKLAADGVANLFLVNRTRQKADEIAAEIQSTYGQCKVEVGIPKTSVNLLINATSLGLKASDPSPLDGTGFQLSNARAVYDMIYRPAETPLLTAAKFAGCRTANGIGMLLYQGAKALELWSGRAAPINVMRRALEENVYGK